MTVLRSGKRVLVVAGRPLDAQEKERLLRTGREYGMLCEAAVALTQAELVACLQKAQDYSGILILPHAAQKAGSAALDALSLVRVPCVSMTDGGPACVEPPFRCTASVAGFGKYGLILALRGLCSLL